MTVLVGDRVKLLIADLHGDSSSVGIRGVLGRDPVTTCLTLGKEPVALPVGTTLEGSGDGVTVVGPDGTRYRLGHMLYGGGSGSTRGEIMADYGTLPNDCGPPPWAVLHDELTGTDPTGRGSP